MSGATEFTTKPAGEPAQLTTRRERFRGELFVFLTTAAVLLPFLDKPFHVDDTLFLRIAEQIYEDPLHPYDFQYNWYQTPMPMWKITQNPPLNNYLVAAIGLAAGFREPAMHFGGLIVAVACALLMLCLSRRFCKHPVLVTLITVLTPAFFVSATTLMADVPMIFLWLLAVYLTVRSIESGREGGLWLAGLAATAAALTKYFGVAVVPLLLAYCLFRRRRVSLHLLAFALPVVGLTLWGLYAQQEAGIFHPLAAAGYSVKEKPLASYLQHAAVTASFLGGALLWPILLLPLGTRLPVWLSGPLGMLAFTAVVFALKVHAASTALPYGLMMLAGLLIVGVCIASCASRFDDAAVLLGLWFFGTLVFTAFFNWTVNARVLLPAAFPAAVLAVRWIETLETRNFWFRYLKAAAWPLAAVSLLIAYADYRFAAASRSFAQGTVRGLVERGDTVHFSGHWGFQHYMEREGARPIDFYALSKNPHLLKPGDVVVYAHPAFNTNVMTVNRVNVSTTGLFEQTIRNPLGFVTMNGMYDAGFYSSLWGVLPFGVGWKPAVNWFIVEQVVAPEPASAGEDTAALGR